MLCEIKQIKNTTSSLESIFEELSFLRAEYPGFYNWYYKKIIPGLEKGSRKVFIAQSPSSFGKIDGLLILKDTPENIWNITSKNSGISLDFFNSYFKNKKVAYAYVLSNPIIYNKPISLEDLNIKAAPQSYIYIDYTQYEKLH